MLMERATVWIHLKSHDYSISVVLIVSNIITKACLYKQTHLVAIVYTH